MCHTRYEIQVSRMLKLNYIKINNEPIKSLDPGSNKVECPYFETLIWTKASFTTNICILFNKYDLKIVH